MSKKGRKKMPFMYISHEDVVWTKMRGSPWWPAKLKKFEVHTDHDGISTDLCEVEYPDGRIGEDLLLDNVKRFQHASEAEILNKSQKKLKPKLAEELETAIKWATKEARRMKQKDTRSFPTIEPGTEISLTNKHNGEIEEKTVHTVESRSSVQCKINLFTCSGELYTDLNVETDRIRVKDKVTGRFSAPHDLKVLHYISGQLEDEDSYTQQMGKLFKEKQKSIRKRASGFEDSDDDGCGGGSSGNKGATVRQRRQKQQKQQEHSMDAEILTPEPAALAVTKRGIRKRTCVQIAETSAESKKEKEKSTTEAAKVKLKEKNKKMNSKNAKKFNDDEPSYFSDLDCTNESADDSITSVSKDENSYLSSDSDSDLVFSTDSDSEAEAGAYLDFAKNSEKGKRTKKVTKKKNKKKKEISSKMNLVNELDMLQTVISNKIEGENSFGEAMKSNLTNQVNKACKTALESLRGIKAMSLEEDEQKLESELRANPSTKSSLETLFETLLSTLGDSQAPKSQTSEKQKKKDQNMNTTTAKAQERLRQYFMKTKMKFMRDIESENA